MKPQDACPQNFVHDGNIVYTSPDGSFSIAKEVWTEDGISRVAMRWNGNINDPNDKGYPCVFGNPMWFQLPYEIKEVLKALIDVAVV